MPGLIPDVGNANALAGFRMQPPDGISAEIPDEKSSATIIRINGDEITVEEAVDTRDTNLALSDRSANFDANLAERLSDDDLNQIGSELLEGIESDIRARADFIANYRKGLDYLGLNLTNQGTSRGKRTTAKVTHPALQWACVKFQSGVRAELLPAAGPVKVWNTGEDSPERNSIASDLEKDMNWYLTVAAPEYYPDTDRGYYYLGYGGTVYKKVYFCPIRQRPVSDCVYLPDMVVSPEASAMQTAIRITHDIGDMTNDDMIRYMSLGIYRETPLTTPVVDDNTLRKAEKEVIGIRPTLGREEDTPYRVFECYTYLDLSKYGIREPGQPKAVIDNNGISSRAPLPYRVTIERDSRTVLEIRRNWQKGDRTFQRKRVFIEYAMVPGMGNANYGYLHLIGNMTQALTALLRLTIDAGMFSNFPGGVRLKGARADTNEINPAPGEFANLDVPLDDIRKAIMAMPYKEPSQVLLALINQLEKQCQSLMGALEFGVGEGKTHIPMGTMLAMIEQQTQNMAAVHKRLHAAQMQEFIALKEVFAQNPESLVRLGNISGRLWSPQMFEDLTLVPAADPNIPSQSHRLMQIAAAVELAKANPADFNIQALEKLALRSLGFSRPDDFMNHNPAPPPPSPDAQAKMAQAEEKRASIQLQARQQEQQLAKQQLEGQMRVRELQLQEQNDAADRESREKIAALKFETEKLKVQAGDRQFNGQGLQVRGYAGGGIVQDGAFPQLYQQGLTNTYTDRLGASVYSLQNLTKSVGDSLAALTSSTKRLRAAAERLKQPRKLRRDVHGRAQSVVETETSDE